MVPPDAITWGNLTCDPPKGLVLTVALCVALGLVIANAIYNIYFHPLRQYPGPLLGRLTPGYGAYHSLKGDMHLNLRALHDKYGRVVRYAPNRLVFNSTAALNDIYGFGKPIRKSTAYLPMVPWEDGWTVISCIDKGLHRKMRRTLVDEMSDETLRMFEPTVLQQLDMFIKSLTQKDSAAAEWSEAKDLSLWSKCLTVESMAQLGFGQTIGLLDHPDPHFILDSLDLYSARMGFFEQWPELAKLGLEGMVNVSRMFSMSVRRFVQWREDFTKKAIDENGRAKRGIFSQLVRGCSKGKGGYKYSGAQMQAEGSFLLLVGSDSNTVALNAALFYLTRFPEVQNRLTREIRDTFQDASEISSIPPSPLLSLPYLKAVTTEVLRMCPPTPGVPWREVEESGATIDGHFIPAKTDVGVCTWVVQRQKHVLREPEKFCPERWLPGTLPEEELHAARAACKPFSIGTRACAGRKIAVMSLYLSLAKILWHCEVKVPSGPLGTVGEGDPEHRNEGRRVRKDFQFETHFTAVAKGPWLQFKLRAE